MMIGTAIILVLGAGYVVALWRVRQLTRGSPVPVAPESSPAFRGPTEPPALRGPTGAPP